MKFEFLHSHLLGHCEGAIKMALIDLDHGHTENAKQTLRRALAEVARLEAEAASTVQS